MAPGRRLAAIMFTDTVGYTAAAQAEEGRTLDLLRQQTELIRPILGLHQGREIKSTGDGFLVEFESALKATQCAINVQRRLYERNSEGQLIPIQIRIGIHLGDVVHSGTDILGDAVNIASRIEPIAEPGGICISSAVYEQIRNKIPDKIEKLPPAQLKGLQLPIDLYRVVLPWSVAETAVDRPASPGLAVLPFANISPDPRDEYIADGLTEELIAVLSQLRHLRVIARTSVTPYKSTSKGVSQIGAELGVSSILEGSVRKSGNRLRITVQLIDVKSQGHVWAHTFDRDLDDVLSIQTEIAKQVTEAMKIELGAAEQTRLRAPHAVRHDSYLAYLKGRTLLHDRSEQSLRAAKEQFELAIKLDAGNASAYAGLSDATYHMATWGYLGAHRVESLEACRALASRAVELDPGLAEAHISLGNVQWLDLQFAAAEREFLLAISLNPSSATAHHWYAFLLEDLGRGEDALQELALAEQADPLSTVILSGTVQLLRWLGRLDEAEARIEKLRELVTSPRGVYFQVFEYYVARSDPKRALEQLDRAKERGSDDPDLTKCYAEYYAWTGDTVRARELLRQFEAQAANLPYREALIADVYTRLNDLDEVFRWLDRAVDSHFVEIRWWRLDPRAVRVRTDPRFQVLLKKLNLT